MVVIRLEYNDGILRIRMNDMNAANFGNKHRAYFVSKTLQILTIFLVFLMINSTFKNEKLPLHPSSRRGKNKLFYCKEPVIFPGD